MIAGGTGITPMLQIIRAIVRGRPRNGGRDTTKVDLIFANVNQEDILMREDLDRLAEEDEGFRVYYVLNNPPQKWGGGVGFCTPDMIKVWMDLFLYFHCCCSRRLSLDMLTCSPGPPPPARDGHQDPNLWAAAYGQRHEESYRVAGLRETEAGQQAG